MRAECGTLGGMAKAPATIGGRLKQLREEREWTRQDVYDQLRDKYGEDAAVPTSTLEKWENDRNEPTATALARLAELYDVSLDYLFLQANGRGNPAFSGRK